MRLDNKYIFAKLKSTQKNYSFDMILSSIFYALNENTITLSTIFKQEKKIKKKNETTTQLYMQS